MTFFRQYIAIFKRLWTNPWFYFLLLMIVIGGHPLKWKIISAFLTAIIFPLLGMLYAWSMARIEQPRKKEGNITKD